MNLKALLVICGLCLLAVNIVGLLLASGITSSLLSRMPTGITIYFIINGIIALFMIILGIKRKKKEKIIVQG